MKLWLTGLLSMTPLPFLISCSGSLETNELIVDVHDGDTMKTESGETLRIFGIDTPEVSTNKTGVWEDTEGIEAMYAKQATELARGMFLNKITHITRMGKVGNYGRSIAKVSINGYDLGEALISKGLARVAYFNVVDEGDRYYSSDYAYFQRLTKLQWEAAKSHIGVWTWASRYKEIFPKS